MAATDRTGPWTYTVGAGRRLSASWSVDAAYDFTLHGPNGFLRRFKGDAGSAGPEVSARDDGRNERVRLVLTNGGTVSARLTVTDAYGNEAPATYLLRPGASVVHTAGRARSHGWYDLSLTSDRDGTFLRRLAGHVESGAPSTSDPAFGSA